MPQDLTPDICVVGGGPGGIAAALAAASAGVSVVLVEKGATGGSDIASGSIPSKALLAAAEINDVLRRAPAIGVTGAPLQVNLGKIREHIAAVTAAVGPHVSAERLTALGVKVLHAAGRFTSRDTLAAGDITIRARRYVLAVGSRPHLPDIPGLGGIDYLTVASAFDLGRKPAHMIVLGAGREGLELAQAYNRLGIDSTILDTGPALPDEDPELVALVVERLRAEGIRIRTGVGIVSVGRRRNGVRFTVSDPEGGDAAVDGSHLLVVAGRKPDVADLNLEVAGIAVNDSGIAVDGNLRTANRRVYVIGDAVAGPAHAARARYQAARVMRSILYRVPTPDQREATPLVTFTDPALASVGISEPEARRRSPSGIRILRFPFIENDRAQIERAPAGIIKVVATSRGRILGAAIVGHDAEEMIALWALAIENRLPISAMAALPAPYPSRAEISRRVAQTFEETGAGLTTPWRRRIIELLRKFG